jgi:hypothetical protein
VRPGLTLPEACDRALASLSPPEREEYFVLSARTRQFSSAEHAGEWHVRLCNARGDQIQLDLDRAGKEVHCLRQNRPSETKAKITSLAEAEKIIPELLKSLEVEGTISRDGNKLKLEINPRTFHIHRELEQRAFAAETEEVLGPGLHGFFLTIEEADFAGDLKDRLEAPKDGLPGTLEFNLRGYFSRTKFAVRTGNPGRVLIVETLIGRDSAKVANAFYEVLERWQP